MSKSIFRYERVSQSWYMRFFDDFQILRRVQERTQNLNVEIFRLESVVRDHIFRLKKDSRSYPFEISRQAI